MSNGTVFALLFVAAAVALALSVGGKPAQDAVVGTCAVGQVVGPKGACLSPYNGPYTPINSPPPPGFVLDPAPSHGPWEAYAKPSVYVDDPDAADRLNEQVAEGWDRRQQREAAFHQQAEEVAFQGRRAAQQAAYRQDQDTDYAPGAVVVSADVLQQNHYGTAEVTQEEPPPLIRHTDTMPNVTAVQVAPNMIWDYSTGQYHQADLQADGSLQERVGE